MCVVVPVPGPMSPPDALESTPHLRVWFVYGVTQAFEVYATLAVRSPALLTMVTDVVFAALELAAEKVPALVGVV